MKKKLIGIVIIGIMITSGFGSIVAAENTVAIHTGKIGILSRMPEPCSESIVNFENKTQVTTVGPVSPILDIAEIIIIAGPIIKTFIIKLILVSMKAYFLLPDIFFQVEDLTFAIKYKKNIPQMPLFQGLSYNTTIKENDIETSFTEKHVLIASGFEGTFGFSRAEPFDLIPASFQFNGTCNEIIVAT